MERLAHQPLPEVSVSKEKAEKLLCSLIAALGNNSAKAISLLTIDEDRWYGRPELSRAFLKVQGVNKAWPQSPNTVFDYCLHSFYPAGLVRIQKVSVDSRQAQFKKTDYGEKVGVAFAGFILRLFEHFDQKYGISLSHVFGDTTSSSSISDIQEPDLVGVRIDYRKRAVNTRLKIFRRILGGNLPLRETDLAEAISEESSFISRHLKYLAQHHIIHYQSSEADQSYSYYQVIKDQVVLSPKALPRYPGLTAEIGSFFLNRPTEWLAAKDIKTMIVANHPEKKESSLLKMIMPVLTHLERQGFLQSQKFHQRCQSEINLSDIQRNMLSELIGFLDEFQAFESNTLEEHRKNAELLISNPQRVNTLLQRAREISHHFNKTPYEVSAVRIVAIIKENPNVSTSQLKTLLEKAFEQRLSRSGIHKILNQMREAGKIKVTAEKNAVYWSVIE